MNVRKLSVIALGLGASFAIAGCGGESEETKVVTKTLSVGDTATLKGAYQKANVEMKVDVEEGSIDDLKDFRLEGDEKKMTPYYVTQTVTNKGKELNRTKGDYPTTSVEPIDDKGLKAKEITLLADFAKCDPVNSPDPFPKGGTYTSCEVHLVREGSKLAKVELQETVFEGKNRKYVWKVS